MDIQIPAEGIRTAQETIGEVMFSKFIYWVFPYNDPKFSSRDPWEHLKIKLSLYGFLFIIIPAALTSRKLWSNLAKSYRLRRTRKKYPEISALARKLEK
jgi:hypothetical protein